MPDFSPTTTGLAPFSVSSADKPCSTWYAIYGTLTPSADALPPLIVLHGGPGSTHAYLRALADLHTAHGRTVVFYDQLGSGRSTHLPEKRGDEAFWTEALFIAELQSLIEHLGISTYDLLGQSWGGMLAARFAAQRPSGLRRLVLSDSPASMELFVEGANRWRKELPQDVQDALDKHEQAGTTSSAEYETAVGAFYARHLCRVQPMPADLIESFHSMEEDPTVYHTMNGPSEFHVTGSLKTWNVIDDIPKIAVPTLVLSGRYDEVQASAVRPFFDGIPRVRWYEFAESSHTPFLEERERYMEIVSGFLLG
ncbi:proline iminopeptidase [Trametopsis cervina]|nr:proline iminopeptidase [Trametopsis cervina]